MKLVENKKYQDAVIKMISEIDDADKLFLAEMKESNKLVLVFGSYLYGALGAKIRNSLKDEFPELNNIEDYGEFEDASYSWFLKAVDEIVDYEENN